MAAKEPPDLKVLHSDLKQCDILLGRGGNNHKFAGNQWLRAIAHELKDKYKKLGKKEKTDLSKEVVKHVCEKGGRFLQRDPENGDWTDMSNSDDAREKVAQCLRDAVAVANKKDKEKKKRVAEPTDENPAKRPSITLDIKSLPPLPSLVNSQDEPKAEKTGKESAVGQKVKPIDKADSVAAASLSPSDRNGLIASNRSRCGSELRDSTCGPPGSKPIPRRASTGSNIGLPRHPTGIGTFMKVPNIATNTRPAVPSLDGSGSSVHSLPPPGTGPCFCRGVPLSPGTIIVACDPNTGNNTFWVPEMPLVLRPMSHLPPNVASTLPDLPLVQGRSGRPFLFQAPPAAQPAVARARKRSGQQSKQNRQAHDLDPILLEDPRANPFHSEFDGFAASSTEEDSTRTNQRAADSLLPDPDRVLGTGGINSRENLQSDAPSGESTFENNGGAEPFFDWNHSNSGQRVDDATSSVEGDAMMEDPLSDDSDTGSPLVML
ncbi:expressed unknown protein [Seminavis robusta]|uniref:DUF6824 domain-containing protein n=1 Tax=Seminavis robusta TaxID=568900 RepID=A0A9N8EAD5_9STRA|nr:expressed unknown protein [Seminavis robusta]|eukprot:Sro879_g214850.1 n/a (489) ;mRNA; f:18299-20034